MDTLGMMRCFSLKLDFYELITSAKGYFVSEQMNLRNKKHK